jgi:hypothetical protein
MLLLKLVVVLRVAESLVCLGKRRKRSLERRRGLSVWIGVLVSCRIFLCFVRFFLKGLLVIVVFVISVFVGFLRMVVFAGMSLVIRWITVLGEKIRLKVVIWLGKEKYVCHVASGVSLPCEWLKGGFCGADVKKCDAKVVMS